MQHFRLKRQMFRMSRRAARAGIPSLGTCRFYGVMVSTLDFESSDPSSNLGRTFFTIVY